MAGNKRNGFCISRCRILISFIFYHMLFAACSPTPPLIAAVEATPTPPISCNNNELALECPPEMYCLNGVCSPCTRCENQNRLPPPNRNCAKGSSECGACTEGFKDYGGLCTDLGAGGSSEDFATPPSRPNPITGDNAPIPKENDQKLYWGLAIGACTTTVIVAFGMWKCSGIKNHNILSQRNRQRQVTGPEEPQSTPNLDHRPSAPLLVGVGEYDQQPPLAPYTFQSFPGPPVHYQPNLEIVQLIVDERNTPRSVMEQQRQTAEPFSIGNGAGTWSNVNDQTQMSSPENQDTGEDQEEVNNNGEQSANDEANDNQVIVTPQSAGFPDLGDQVMEEADVSNNIDSQDVEMEDEPNQELAEVFAPHGPLNIEVSELFLEIDIGFAVGLFNSNLSSNASQPTPSSSSSPLTSPVPGHSRVRHRSQAVFDPEETYFDLLAINAPLSSSFLSFGNDSGTGTGSVDSFNSVNDRVVPSQASSQEANRVVPGSEEPDESGLYGDDGYGFDDDFNLDEE